MAGLSESKALKNTLRGIGVVIAAALLVFFAYVAVEGPYAEARMGRRGFVFCLGMLVSLILWIWADARGKKAPSPTVVPLSAVKSAAPAPSQSAENLVLRSDNVVQTLRDLVEHGQGAGDFGMLPALLVRSGIMDWQNPPVVEASKLSRNGRFWLTAQGDISDDDYDRLIALEAALNVNADVSAGATVEQVFSNVLMLSQSYRPGPYLSFFIEGAAEGGEWSLRNKLGDFAEGVGAPFRVQSSFWTNAEAGTVLIELLIPRPQSMYLLAIDNPERAAQAAKAYAIRSGLLLAYGAFVASSAVRRVYVNCHERGDEDADFARCSRSTRLHLDLTRERLNEIMPQLPADPFMAAGLPDTEVFRKSVHCKQDESGRLLPIPAEVNAKDISDPALWNKVELSHEATNEEVRRTCGAAHVSELGINESAGRAQAWSQISLNMGTTTSQAVSELMDEKGTARDLSVIEACDRTSKALVDGTYEVGMTDELRELFMHGSSLAQMSDRLRRILNQDGVTPEQVEEVLSAARELVAPLDELGMYQDDSDTVYRYFNCTAERLHYNLTGNAHDREVRLVPDEYYNLRLGMARAYTRLGKFDEAIAEANEIMRVAPVTPDAALVKVRALEDASRTFEAAAVLMDAIRYASTPRDMGICFYRLAYMEWKLGRSDLCVACYQRAIELGGDAQRMARSELDDLLSDNPNLRPYREEELPGIITGAQIPYGEIRALKIATRDAARALTDAHIFEVARSMTSTLVDLQRDDALIDVYRSLVPYWKSNS